MQTPAMALSHDDIVLAIIIVVIVVTAAVLFGDYGVLILTAYANNSITALGDAAITRIRVLFF